MFWSKTYHNVDFMRARTYPLTPPFIGLHERIHNKQSHLFLLLLSYFANIRVKKKQFSFKNFPFNFFGWIQNRCKYITRGLNPQQLTFLWAEVFIIFPAWQTCLHALIRAHFCKCRWEFPPEWCQRFRKQTVDKRDRASHLSKLNLPD